MKHPFLFLIFFASCMFVFACKPDAPEKASITEVGSEVLAPSTIQRDTFTPAQLADIRTIHATFSEVYPVSLDETIKNFKRDQDPNREIQIWMKMVGTFNALTNNGNYPRIEQRQEVFSVILASTMMPIEKIKADVELTELQDKEVDQIVGLFMASFKSE